MEIATLSEGSRSLFLETIWQRVIVVFDMLGENQQFVGKLVCRCY